MIVRLRFSAGPQIRKSTGKNRHIAAAIAALMWPAVLTTYVVGFWALSAQIKLAGTFSIASGVLSHWQFWLLIGLSLHVATFSLSRYGQNGAFSLPQLFSWLSQFGNRRTSE